MQSCLTCGGEPPLCDACVESTLGVMTGHAKARGMGWAQRVAAKLGTAAPASWPPFGGRCRAIAERLVRDLGHDERVHLELARACWADAERWWSRRPR